MFTNPVMARVIVDERQSASIRRAAESRLASHATGRAKRVRRSPIRPRGRPVISIIKP